MSATTAETRIGTDGDLDYLLDVWPDGSIDLATRPAGSGATWSAPIQLRSAK